MKARERARIVKEAFAAFQDLRFPSPPPGELPDLHLDLAAYDTHLSGLVDHVASGKTPPMPIELDPQLRAEVEASGHAPYLEYLDALEALAVRARLHAKQWT